MLLIVGPLVWLASANYHFQETYPFIDLERGTPLWPLFWTWEPGQAGLSSQLTPRGPNRLFGIEHEHPLVWTVIPRKE